MQKNADSEESLSNLVLMRMAKQNFDMVREYSEHPAELRPESSVALGRAGRMGLRGGEHALTAKFSRCWWCGAETLRSLGSIWRSRIRNRRAKSTGRDAYEEALKLRPQSCEGHTNLGIVREQLRISRALARPYRPAMKSHTEALGAVWNFRCCWSIRDSSRAERHYRQVLDRAPKEEEARFRMATCRLQRED